MEIVQRDGSAHNRASVEARDLAHNLVGLVRYGLKVATTIVLAVCLAGCLRIEGSSPILQRSDLAAFPDYSGTYLSYELDESGKIEPALPKQMAWFQKVSEGEYRFALQSTDDQPAQPVFGGYLYLLDVGDSEGAVGIAFGPSRKGPDQSLFFRIKRASETRFDFALFIQYDEAKYLELTKIARRYQIELDPESEGSMKGKPTGDQLRAAFQDPDFLPNVDLEFKYTFILQDPDASWPDQIVIKDVASVGLKVAEDRAYWHSVDAPGACSLEYAQPENPAIVAVHSVRGQLALEVRPPGPASSGADRRQLHWQIDGGRRHTLWSERPVLSPDTLVAFPIDRRFLEELARGRELTISVRGMEDLRLPLDGSAREVTAFGRCIGT